MREWIARKVWKLGTRITNLACRIRDRHIPYIPYTETGPTEIHCAICGEPKIRWNKENENPLSS